PCPPTNFKQALIPLGAEALMNPVGTAPGIFWDSPEGFPGKQIVLLPGVPREMKRMWEDHVEPLLLPSEPIHTLRMLVGSIGESALDERTTPLRQAHGHLDWAILASLGLVELVAHSRDAAALEAARVAFELELGADRICTGSGTLESTVLKRLQQKGETLALAESMTGGRVAALLTAVPGSSAAFLGGAVVYSAKAKTQLVDLPDDLLRAHGTVSETVTRALAEGIRHRLGADWGLAITGNAGPTEDRDGSAPLGTSFIAVAGPGGTVSLESHFPGQRIDVQVRTTNQALDFLRRAMA
ncbi:MAG: nicotinamide-nucleotide amidohydrolase family protein, partial [Holophaga sp.]|nr:nicotinamide-nucleotide amidohydrolase family protein [Holophaga sp.]